MGQMYEIAGVTPRDVVILTDEEVVIELEVEASIMEVSRVVHGLYQWAGQSITVDSVVARRGSIKEIVKEWGDCEREAERIGMRTSTNERGST